MTEHAEQQTSQADCPQQPETEVWLEEYEFLFLSGKPNQPLLGHGACDTPWRGRFRAQ